MPELPEVETVARGLKRLEGQTLREITLFDNKVWFESDLEPEAFSGLRLKRVQRHGKYIVYDFGAAFLLQHLRMTGKMLPVNSAAIPESLRRDLGHNKQIRLVLKFEKETICFWDTRRFGTFTAVASAPEFLKKKKLAPDPIHQPEDAVKVFHTRLALAKRPLKTALLDQSIVAGVGNIYADEALYRRQLHPEFVAAKLSKSERDKLFQSILKIFDQAIGSGGTTANNYLNADGDPGTFSEELKVYDREGEKCFRCRKTSIKRITLAGRSSHFCPKCQTKAKR